MTYISINRNYQYNNIMTQYRYKKLPCLFLLENGMSWVWNSNSGAVWHTSCRQAPPSFLLPHSHSKHPTIMYHIFTSWYINVFSLPVHLNIYFIVFYKNNYVLLFYMFFICMVIHSHFHSYMRSICNNWIFKFDIHCAVCIYYFTMKYTFPSRKKIQALKMPKPIICPIKAWNIMHILKLAGQRNWKTYDEFGSRNY